MKNRISLIFLLGMSVHLNAQVITLGVDQPQLLQAIAGNDTLMCKNHSFELGGQPSAMGGTGEYLYLWYPDTYLDDPTAANPLCTPDETTSYTLTVTDNSGCMAISTVSIAVDPCTGIDDSRAFSSDVQVYPNPVSDAFTISGLGSYSGEVTLTLFNQIGQVQFEYRLDHPLSGEISIQPGKALKPGSYILSIQTSHELITQSIQVK